MCVVLRFIRNDLNYIPETKSRKTLYKCIYSEYFLLCVLVLYRFLNSREGTGFFSPCFHAAHVRMTFKSQVRHLGATVECYNNNN